MEFLFIDGEQICIYKDGEVKEYKSGYIEKYKQKTFQSVKNNEWRKKSRTEILLNEDFYPDFDDGEFSIKLNSAWFLENENEILYAFTVNDNSGIYRKYLDDEKIQDAHIVYSNQLEFTNIFYENNNLIASVKKGEVAGDIAIFSKDLADYKFVTGGDSLDENPYLHTDGKIYFNSYGVARDEVGNCLGYGGSEIFSLDLKTMEVEEILSSEKYSLVKPIPWRDGFLMITKPINDKEKSNVLLDILMIPVRILQGIVGFISAFVTFFSGKPLVSDNSPSSNGYTKTKKMNKDEKKIFISNQLVNIDKEMKKNKKDEYPSFIPKSWQLIHVKENEKENVLTKTFLSSIVDYCLIEENKIIATNGKFIFLIVQEEKSWTSQVIFETNCCLKVFPIPKTKDSTQDLYSLL
jgi:hypothetical protein